MFKTLQVKNFQPYKNTLIHFVKGLNVIVGPSHAGKSSLFRCIEWLMTNRPTSIEEFKSRFAEDNENVKVALELEDGAFIIREKGPKVNSYTTQDDAYEAVGTDCPKEVLDILKMGEYNIQGQMDKYIFFQQSPGEIARYLNKLVGLDVIDRGYKNIEIKVRDTRAIIKECSTRAEKLENDLEKYDGLDEAIKKLAELEKISKRYQDRENEQNILESEVTAIKALLDKKDRIDSWLKIEGELLILKNQKAQVSKLTDELSELEDDMNNVKRCSYKIAASMTWMNIQPHIVLLQRNNKDLENNTSELSELSKVINKIKEINQHVQFTYSSMQQTAQLYLDTLERMKICPRCGGPITKKIIERERKRLEL